jgi:phage terminase large subunit-like protein
MVEGESGILAISPDPERPLYEPSKRRLTWPNGAVAAADSSRWDGENPSSSRGESGANRAVLIIIREDIGNRPPYD